MPLRHPSWLATAFTQACVLEVMAPKAGNVHPGAAFADCDWWSFVQSAQVCAPLLAQVEQTGVGHCIAHMVRATQTAVGVNTNLGILLLCAPLAKSAQRVLVTEQRLTLTRWRRELQQVLRELSLSDARAVYRAIALSKPGGLGQVKQGDVTRREVMPLREAMQLASPHDWIAREYVTDFACTFTRIVPWLTDAWTPARRPGHASDVLQAIVKVQLQQLAHEPDSLIVRKNNLALAKQVCAKSAAVLRADWPNTLRSRQMFNALDHWLRDAGHRRNPGTTADLIAAGLLVKLLLQAHAHQP